jgi:hypothetical protein
VEDILQLVFKSYGLIGVFLVLPGVACIFLWKENKRLTAQLQANHEEAAKKIQECNDRIIEAHRTRVTDAQAISTRLMAMAGEQASTNKETILALDRLGEMLSNHIGHGSMKG